VENAFDEVQGTLFPKSTIEVLNSPATTFLTAT
jgi:hypothetical protein